MSGALADEGIANLARSARESGLDIVVGDGFGRPDLIILDPARGVFAIDGTAEKKPSSEIIKALNRKIAQLTAEVPELDDFPIHALVLCTQLTSVSEKYLLPASASKGLTWLESFGRKKFDADALADAVGELGSSITFTMGGRGEVVDIGAEERTRRRFSLDETQSSAAIRRVEDVLLITGPAGSGKSLVLAARARWLSAKHPEWRIQILCYNKALVSYLRSLVEGHENVEVETFGRFSYNLGHRFAFEDSEQADLDLKRAMRKGIDITVDALLIDESQDFFDGWFRFAAECVFPGRGGIVIAGDNQQALYRESSVRKALKGHSIDEVTLPIPYRSTRQILDVVAALDPELEVLGYEEASEGSPVELVWAESIAEQARALTTDLRILNSQGRPWSDMCMLVTQKFMVGPVAGALKREEVPFSVVNTGNALSLDLAADNVKILTVHSAKGLEFGVVCLLGLEQLKDPDDKGLDVDEHVGRERTSRLCLVGPTRARDLLFISYTKNSIFLERLRSSEAPFRAWSWPEDYVAEN